MKLLHIDSSIQGEASASRVISAAIVEHLIGSDMSIEVAYRDLVENPPQHIDFANLATITAHPVLREFLEANVIVIGAPMYNFSIPSQLKAWIDHVVVAGKTFKYGPEGAIGLAGEKRVIIAQTRGGIYSDGPAVQLEHAESYLRTVLGFIGIANPEFLAVEGLALGTEEREAAMATALKSVSTLARSSLEAVA